MSKATANLPWYKTEGIVHAGGWHPLPARIRNGGKSEDEEDLYAWEYTEAHILRLKELGINLLQGQCDRGLGPTDQAPHQELARQQAALCHKHGLHHATYIANTVYFESMLKDYPDCEDWVVKTHDGRLVHYGGEQTFRWVGCFNSPGWRDRTKREIKIAIDVVKTDWLHLDNLAVWPEPDSCHCDYCQAAFKAFLLKRYPDAESQTHRFGFPGLDHFRAPNFYLRFIEPWDLAASRNPLMQDWIDFRCHTVTDYVTHLVDYARSLKPDIIIDANGQSIWGVNQALVHGIRHDHQAPIIDVMHEENGDCKPEETRPCLHTIRLFRGMNYVRRLNGAMITAYRDDVELARNMTLAGHPGIHTSWGYAEPKQSPLNPGAPGVPELLAHYRRHTALYTPVRPAARTGIWRNYHSLAYDNFESHLSACVMEYCLFSKRIPFSIILDSEITGDGPADIDLLIIPNMQYIDDHQVDVLTAFVQRGGSLLILEKSGAWNGQQRLRRSNPFAPLFAGATFAHDQIEEAANFDPNQQFVAKGQAGKPMTAHYGHGRVAYLPAIDYVHPARSLDGGLYNSKYQGCDSRYWQIPHNWDEILATLDWLSTSLIPFRLFGAEHIYLDATILADERRALPFFRLNGNAPANLHVIWQTDSAPQQPTLYLPEHEQPLPLRITRNGHRHESTLPPVRHHGVVTWHA